MKREWKSQVSTVFFVYLYTLFADNLPSMENCGVLLCALHLLIVFCLNDCKELKVHGCTFSGNYCSDNLYSQLSTNIENSMNLSDDVILFADIFVIQRQCRQTLFGVTYRGIGFTKVRKLSDGHTIGFKFFPVGLSKVLTMEEMKTNRFHNASRLDLQCQNYNNPVESWNVTNPSDNCHNSDSENEFSTGEESLFRAIAELFKNVSSQTNTSLVEFKFGSLSGSLALHCSIDVNSSETYKWEINCETMPNMTTTTTTTLSITTPTTSSTTTPTTSSTTTPTTSSTTTPTKSSRGTSASYPTTERQTNEGNCDKQKNMLKADSLKSDGCTITSTHLAIAVILSFLAGVIVTFLLLLFLRSRGSNVMCTCLEKKDIPGQAKWDGTANTVKMESCSSHSGGNGAEIKDGPVINSLSHPTYEDQKIYSKLDKGKCETEHVYDKSQTAYEKLGTRITEKSGMRTDEHVYNAPESTYQGLSGEGVMENKQGGQEHVYTGLTGQQRARHHDATEAYRGASSDTPSKTENLFENRDSTTSEHKYFTLQNDNFRISNKVEEKATPSPRLSEDTGTYFVLEKETMDGEKDEKETEKAENTYFVLEKDASKMETIHDTSEEEKTTGEHAYFVLEKPRQ